MAVSYGICNARSSSLGYVLIVLGRRWIFVETNTRLGYAFAFGIFQDYYSTHEPFKGSENIAIIGTCAMVGWQDTQGRPLSLTQHIGYRISDCPVGNNFDDLSA